MTLWCDSVPVEVIGSVVGVPLQSLADSFLALSSPGRVLRLSLTCRGLLASFRENWNWGWTVAGLGSAIPDKLREIHMLLLEDDVSAPDEL
eukprot:2783619-Pyramimonas_sp.AAC.1